MPRIFTYDCEIVKPSFSVHIIYDVVNFKYLIYFVPTLTLTHNAGYISPKNIHLL
jgi:hypothetical protein